MERNIVFDIDRSKEMTEFYFFQNGLTSEEVDWIKENVNELPIQDGKIANNSDGEELQSIRKSTIRWIPQNQKYEWIYERLMAMVLEANEMWGFDLHSIPDNIQYTEYDEGGGHYDWHMDIGPNELSVRKVSLTIQLSDSDEYEGGELQLLRGRMQENMPKGKGCVVVFPSYLLHRVSPVTKGKRISMVIWVGGGHYK